MLLSFIMLDILEILLYELVRFLESVLIVISINIVTILSILFVYTKIDKCFFLRIYININSILSNISYFTQEVKLVNMVKSNLG